MECLWRLFSHWQPDGHCHQPDPAVLHVYIDPHDGLPHYHLYGACFLEKYAPLYLGCQKKSLVLPLKKCPDEPGKFSYFIADIFCCKTPDCIYFFLGVMITTPFFPFAP